MSNHDHAPRDPQSSTEPAPADEPAPPHGDDWADAPAPIGPDCPCITCGYNLRALPEDGCCPECGRAVADTLEMVSERLLCPGCLMPNHPSATACAKCGNPIGGATAAANYFRGGSGGGSSATRVRLTSVILVWVFLGPLAMGCLLVTLTGILSLVLDPGTMAGEESAMVLLSAVVAAATVPILFHATKAYVVRRRQDVKDAQEDDDDPRAGGPPATRCEVVQ